MASNGISATSQPPIPIFDGDNYGFWSIKMKTLFQSQDLWEFIEHGYDATEKDDQKLKESKKKDAKALFFLQQSVSDSLFPRIASATTSKAAWETLQTDFQGSAKVIQGEELDVDLFRAAMEGDQTIFGDPNVSIERLSRKSADNNNIIHIALQYRQQKFITALLRKKKYADMNMKLLCERNSRGNTPFHVAAQMQDVESYCLMLHYYLRKKKRMRVAGGHHDDGGGSGGGDGGGDSDGGDDNGGNDGGCGGDNGGGDDGDNDDDDVNLHNDDDGIDSDVDGVVRPEPPPCVGAGIDAIVRSAFFISLTIDELADADNGEQEERPWRAKNSEGNTALHLAILTFHGYLFNLTSGCLGKWDPALARIVNNSRESPLHLAVTKGVKDEIRGLLKAARCVVTWRDLEGFTPLHRLALLPVRRPSFVIEVAEEMIDVCPESMLVCDASGKSFLHHLAQNKKIFDDTQQPYEEATTRIKHLICRREMSPLINLQDQDRNTALHVALKCDNIPMVKLLVSECDANEFKLNKDGISAMSIMQEKGLVEEIYGRRVMEANVRSLAEKGDVISLMKNEGYYFIFSSRDSEGSNILHLLMSKATEHHYYSSSNYGSHVFQFINNALLWNKNLVYQTDGTGNNPLHILAQNNDLCSCLADLTSGAPSLLSKLLSDFAEAITKVESKGTSTAEPWVMQNAHGNTPLHEAIIASNKVLVLELLSYSLESTTMILNKNKETPLHLLAGTTTSMDLPMVEEVIMKVVNAHSEALRLQDNNGLIPMLRAIRANNLNVLAALLCNFQDFRNTNGQTLWQIFLQDYQSHTFWKQLLRHDAFKKMLEQKNKDGNTPLHIAIQDNHFDDFVQHLLGAWNTEQDNIQLMKLLKISNKLGQTSGDLLADLPTISVELEKKLLTDHRTRGIRSSWKIPRTQLQNYMSSMNVIAALQTTITFTAAFTVPGGLNQEKGTPILMQSIPFQVFMILDVVAMCLSMMVLICQLWMVAITDKRKSVMIQDFALTVLLLSFIATILTFMMGVWATIYPVTPWIAITTVVLCGLLMIVCLRRSVLTNVVRFFNYLNYLRVLIYENLCRLCWPHAGSTNRQEQSSENMPRLHADSSDPGQV